MCHGTTFEAWQAQCIRRLLAVGRLDPCLILCRPESGDARFGTAEPSPGGILFRAYRRMLCNPPALRPVDLSAELSDVPMVECRTIPGDGLEDSAVDVAGADIEALESRALDFILVLGFDNVRGGIVDAVRHGVWAFRYGEGTRHRAAPAGFREVADGDPVTVATLERLTGRPGEGVVLRRGCFPTIGYSYAANLNQVLDESAVWPVQVCLGLLQGDRGSLDDPPVRTMAAAAQAPGNLETALLVLTMIRNLLVETCRVLFRHEQWNVGLVRRPIQSFLEGSAPQIRWLPDPGRGRFLADPFGVSEDGCVHVFCEDYDYKTMRGRISYLQVSETDRVLSTDSAMDKPYHLSYPYLIRHRGELYCIPESSGSGRVVLYKSRGFPGDWEEVATLLEGFSGLDVTVFQHDGMWWMACADVTDGRCHKLFLWHAPDLLGPWAPHLLNPVKVDVTSSRPGGTPFVHDGKLYRPAQDCSRTYGGRVVINRVCELTTTGFREERAAVVEPDTRGPYRHGVHTISAAGDVTLVDGKRYVFSPNACLHGVAFLFRKLTGRSTLPPEAVH